LQIIDTMTPSHRINYTFYVPVQCRDAPRRVSTACRVLSTHTVANYWYDDLKPPVSITHNSLHEVPKPKTFFENEVTLN